MAKLARNHHFVPRLILRGFTIGGEDTDPLFIFDKQKRRQAQSTPWDAGKQKDLYLLERVDGQWSDAFENELGRAESALRPTLQEVLQAREVPKPIVTRGRLLQLVALQYFRTPLMKQRFTDRARDALVRIKVEDFNSGEFHRTWVKEHGVPPTADQVRLYQQTTEMVHRGEISVQMNQSMWTDVLTECTNKSGALLAFRQWHLLTAKPEAADFVTSDAPVVLSLRKPEVFPPLFSPGIASPHTWIVMALDRRNALIGSHEGNHPRGPADTNQVGFINGLIIKHAARFIYSSRPEIAWRKGREVLGTADLIDEPAEIRI